MPEKGEKRRIPGKRIPTDEFYPAFECTKCGGTRTVAKGGPENTTLSICCSALTKNGKIPITKHVRGLTEVFCCGEWLVCGGFTNTCDRCGADYNMSGQWLADRSQWGEETGETADEILKAEAAGFPEIES
jgi:hypothetical protein